MKPRVYNRSMEMVGVLENATNISLTKPKNDLHAIEFELPFEDPKNDICDTFFIVEAFNGEVSKGKYRILDEPDAEITAPGEPIRYYCEHVIAFLVNDALNGYFEIGGDGINTRTVIEALLAKQPVTRWVLGTCDFAHEFKYSWENTNLLDAIFSVPKLFAEKYHWTYDTTTYPWTLNLVEQDTSRACEIRRKKNMRSIVRAKDSTMLCTRLYCKGYGEGVNQLGIEKATANTLGLPYIDADTQATYGIVASHFIDLTITDADALYAKGLMVLDSIKNPWFTYRAQALELQRITGRAWDAFEEGTFVHLVDEEKGIDADLEIIETQQPDIDADPENCEVIMSNKSSDVASLIEDLARRASITAQYSQGATNIYTLQYADNADASHPAIMRFYIPSALKRINQLLLSWRLSAFRAYADGAAYGGGGTETSQSSGGSVITSEAGGDGTTGTQGTQQTNNAYLITDQPDDAVSGASVGNTGSSSLTNTGNTFLTTDTSSTGSSGTSSGTTGSWGGSTGNTFLTSDNASTGSSGSSGGTTGASSGSTGSQDPNTGGASPATSGSSAPSSPHTHSIGHTHSVASHSHSLNSHTHSTPDHSHTIWHTHDVQNHNHTIPSHTHSIGDHSHTIWHTHDIQNHNHSMSHTHTLADHTHTIFHTHDIQNHNHTIPSHSHTIAAHSHSVTISAHSHSVTIPSHNHDLVHGIYEGPTATSVTIKVDGNTIPPEALESSEMDIADYLDVDTNGRITRGVWHEIEITPDTLTRIEANLHVQLFVTSYEGGDY